MFMRELKIMRDTQVEMNFPVASFYIWRLAGVYDLLW